MGNNMMKEFAASRRVVDEVLNERLRQKFHLGYGTVHDDEYTEDQLPRAAAVYALCGVTGTLYEGGGSDWRLVWPQDWDMKYHPARKGKSHRECLIAAAALITAEIERMDRAAIRLTDKKPEPDNSVGAKIESVTGRDERADREAARAAAAMAGPPMESGDGESLLKAGSRVHDGPPKPVVLLMVDEELGSQGVTDSVAAQITKALDIMDYIVTAPAVNGGNRVGGTADVAYHLRDMGVSADKAVTLMTLYWNPRNQSPLSPITLKEIVTRAYNYADEQEAVAGGV